ncbi:MAG: hypothetical protein IKH34_06265 [Oscillospiraceae bacterium]|nr:hypothetical protein [Oscillospiraceae bacterium]
MSRIIKSLRAAPKWIWLLCTLFLGMQYLICWNVFPMGDDFMYGSFGREGVFAPVFSYYLTGNGRWLINLLDALQLRFGRIPFLALTPWLLLLLGWLLYRLVCLMTDTRKPALFGFSLALLALVDIQMSRECIYWITGAMNYLIPALFLLAGMIAALRLREKDLSKRSLFRYGTLCVLSCVTMEQYSLMAFGWMLLIWGVAWLRERSVPKRLLLILLLSAAALASVLFAPGNFWRLYSARECWAPVIFKINDLICYDYYSMVSTAFLFVLTGLCALRFLRAGKWIPAVLSAANALLLLAFRNAVLHARFSYVSVSLLVTFLTVVPALIAIFRRCGSLYLITLTVIGLGSQIMLVSSELWGFRTSFCWVLILILFLLVWLSQLQTPEEGMEAACLLCLAMQPLFGLFALALCCVCRLRKRGTAAVLAILLLAAVPVGLLDEVLGYRENRAVQLEIRQAAEKAAEGQVSELVLRPYDAFLYGWGSPPLSKFHEGYYRSYYGIPDSVVIRYPEQPAGD